MYKYYVILKFMSSDIYINLIATSFYKQLTNQLCVIGNG